jgi:hypothetical protein
MWFDVLRHRVVRGGVTLTGYPAAVSQTPMFIRLGTTSTGSLMHSFAPGR